MGPSLLIDLHCQSRARGGLRLLPLNRCMERFTQRSWVAVSLHEHFKKRFTQQRRSQ
jgi:hypothetical protein